MTPLKNHVDAKHVTLNKKIEEEVNSSLNRITENNLLKNDQVFLVPQFLIFLLPKVLSKNVMLNNNNL